MQWCTQDYLDHACKDAAMSAKCRDPTDSTALRCTTYLLNLANISRHTAGMPFLYG